MIALLIFLLRLLLLPSRPELRLEAENAALRQQLIILQRKVRGCVQLTNSDRLFFVQLYRWFPSGNFSHELLGFRILSRPQDDLPDL